MFPPKQETDRGQSHIIGIFGAACWMNEGQEHILVNVRADQASNRRLAELPAESTVKIVDLPGGGVRVQDYLQPSEPGFGAALRREFLEETGCQIVIVDNRLHQPEHFVPKVQEPTIDLAFWLPVITLEKPRPSIEALEHHWITREELMIETHYRAPGMRGKEGRMARMILAAMNWWREHWKREWNSYP